MTLVLMGLRGSGKTTLGRTLAHKLSLSFVDLDDRTPDELGEQSVRDAFTKYGEEAFRHAEACALEQVLAERPGVIALGGGTPVAPGAHELIRAAQLRGVIRVVYLRAAPETLRARLSGADNAQRPALVGDDPVTEIAQVHADRDPIYSGLADTVIETDGLMPEEALDLLIEIAEK